MSLLFLSHILCAFTLHCLLSVQPSNGSLATAKTVFFLFAVGSLGGQTWEDSASLLSVDSWVTSYLFIWQTVLCWVISRAVLFSCLRKCVFTCEWWLERWKPVGYFCLVWLSSSARGYSALCFPTLENLWEVCVSTDKMLFRTLALS